MQTFLPYRDFSKTASCFDFVSGSRRLRKQLIEVKQILQTLNGETEGWCNHPAVRMWLHAEDALVLYGKAIFKELKKRGYGAAYKEVCNDIESFYVGDPFFPLWLGNKSFHRSHQSNLLRKDKQHYSQFNWKVSDRLDYVWPINGKDDLKCLKKS